MRWIWKNLFLWKYVKFFAISNHHIKPQIQLQCCSKFLCGIRGNSQGWGIISSSLLPNNYQGNGKILVKSSHQITMADAFDVHSKFASPPLKSFPKSEINIKSNPAVSLLQIVNTNRMRLHNFFQSHDDFIRSLIIFQFKEIIYLFYFDFNLSHMCRVFLSICSCGQL